MFQSVMELQLQLLREDTVMIDVLLVHSKIATDNVNLAVLVVKLAAKWILIVLVVKLEF